jgi:hypothetical protein
VRSVSLIEGPFFSVVGAGDDEAAGFSVSAIFFTSLVTSSEEFVDGWWMDGLETLVVMDLFQISSWNIALSISGMSSASACNRKIK